MFSHVMVGTNDIERAKRFYDAVLQVLGAGEAIRDAAKTGHQRLFYRHDGATFCVSEPINDEPATSANGAQCYNCHQVDKKEISFGTIGPSLWNYGKLRGVKDLNDPASAPIIQYTWGKLWNSKAYSACSNMPRFGHAKLLDEQQIRDVMALLLDPKSPVNQ